MPDNSVYFHAAYAAAAAIYAGYALSVWLRARAVRGSLQGDAAARERGANDGRS